MTKERQELIKEATNEVRKWLLHKDIRKTAELLVDFHVEQSKKDKERIYDLEQKLIKVHQLWITPKDDWFDDEMKSIPNVLNQ